MNSWLSRLYVSASAVAVCGGLVFLSGCEDCDECEKVKEVACDPCEGETVHSVSYEPASARREISSDRHEMRESARHGSADRYMNGDGRETRSAQDTLSSYERSRAMGPDATPSAGRVHFSSQDLQAKRDRLNAIEDERQQYPERAQRLDAEADRLNRELTEANAQEDINNGLYTSRERDEQGTDVSNRVQGGVEINSGVKTDIDLERDRSIRAREIPQPPLSEQRLRLESEQRASQVRSQSELDANARPNRDVRLNNRSEIRSTNTTNSGAFSGNQPGLNARDNTRVGRREEGAAIQPENTNLNQSQSDTNTTNAAVPNNNTRTNTSTVPGSNAPAGEVETDAQFNPEAPGLNPGADATNQIINARDPAIDAAIPPPGTTQTTGSTRLDTSIPQPTTSQTTITPAGTINSTTNPQTGTSTTIDVSGPSSNAIPNTSNTPTGASGSLRP